MVDKVTVIIPALNEPYLPSLLKHLGNYDVHVRSEKGLSFAVWKGIQESNGELIVVLDGDGSHSPNAIPRMIDMLNSRTCLVVGSRYCKGGYSYDSTLRKIVSLVYCFIARLVLRTKIKDVMSGFWVGRREAFKFNPSRNFKFGLQLIKKNKGYIVEYPIVFEKRKSGRSKMKPLQALKDLFSIFRNRTEEVHDF